MAPMAPLSTSCTDNNHQRHSLRQSEGRRRGDNFIESRLSIRKRGGFYTSAFPSAWNIRNRQRLPAPRKARGVDDWTLAKLPLIGSKFIGAAGTGIKAYTGLGQTPWLFQERKLSLRGVAPLAPRRSNLRFSAIGPFSGDCFGKNRLAMTSYGFVKLS